MPVMMPSSAASVESTSVLGPPPPPPVAAPRGGLIGEIPAQAKNSHLNRLLTLDRRGARCGILGQPPAIRGRPPRLPPFGRSLFN
jgi:hypothetical protein